MKTDEFIRREGQILYHGSGSNLDRGPVRKGDLVQLVTKAGNFYVKVLDATDVNAIIGTVSKWMPTEKNTLTERNDGDVVTFSEKAIHTIRR